VVIVCLSKQFNQAGFRQKEVRLALDTAMEKPEGEIFIIPARLEECDTLESLRKWHWVDLFEPTGYKRLMLALNEKANHIKVSFELQEQYAVKTPADKLFVQNIETTLLAGDVLENRYRIVKVVNITSYSRIVQAWDEILKRKVAIKFIYFPETDRQALTSLTNNLKRELKILLNLAHPNIVKVYDLIQDPIGTVLEWIDGKSLQSYLDEHKVFDVSEVLRIGFVLADVLSYIHSRGVVHRDIKPSNIILNTSNEPILADFSIAEISNLETISLTDKGDRFFVGTPMYSSPEQLGLGDVNSASDIFSLGVVMYEMLTFQLPYKYGNQSSQYNAGIFPKPNLHKIPKPIYELLCQMLSQYPDERPLAIELHTKLKLIYSELFKD
jgi:serine/threonine protein kinase